MELSSYASTTAVRLKDAEPVRVAIACHRSRWPHPDWLDVLRTDERIGSVTFASPPYEPFGDIPGVVVLCSPEPVDALQQLTNALGGGLPPVLLVTPVVEPRQIAAVFESGVTGCLVRDDYTECSLTGALLATAAGQLTLSPLAASALTKGSSPASSPRTQEAGESGSSEDTVEGGVPGLLRRVLSMRERQIMDLLASGYDAAEIGGLLFLTETTVRSVLSSIHAKLQAHGSTEAVLLWLGRSPRRGAVVAIDVS